MKRLSRLWCWVRGHRYRFHIDHRFGTPEAEKAIQEIMAGPTFCSRCGERR